MEQTIKIRLLECIGNIYEVSRDCKLETAFFDQVDKELTELSNYFGISHTQSLLMAMVFSLNYRGDTVDFNTYSGDMHPVIPVICTQFGG